MKTPVGHAACPVSGISIFVMLLCLAVLSACATGEAFHKTPGLVSPIAKEPSASGLLYITDRAPKETSGKLSYGASRSPFISFGNVALAYASPSTAGKRTPAHVAAVTEIGRFPPVPYPVEITTTGPRRTQKVVLAHGTAEAALQAEVARRLSSAKRKEVVLFIHGYNNTFDDAAVSTENICKTLSDEFVCVVLTWPAGGSAGVFQGYNVDRESGEFAVADIKKIIRMVGEAKGVERLHIIAHSRGTDVLASAMQQLGIEAYVAQSSISQRFKISNLILFAPDIDMDVAGTKLFGIVSDPDALYGKKAKPDVNFPSTGTFHLTVYSSPNDRALGLSAMLFGSAVRLGQLSVGHLPTANGETQTIWKAEQLAGLADFIEYEGNAGFIGHGYFLTDATVRQDMVALIRDRLKAGDPGRSLIEIKKPYWRLAPHKSS